MRLSLRAGFLIVLFSHLVLLPVGAADRLNFNRDVRPILSDKCFSCHGLDKNARKADLRLDQRDAAIQVQAIVAGQPDKSHLIERINSTETDTVMPPIKANKPLTADQKSILRRWIEEGAEYQPHWSLIPVAKAIPTPHVDDADHWCESPIDVFVLDRLRRDKLEPAVTATREKWLRRVTFDLNGLPPTVAELDAFLNDTTSNAKDRVVDRLLKSPAYGERMTNEWLDVARYADTFGYQSDRDTHVWPWRDWVIRSFNENLPYDQFIIWQTAGDLLPSPTGDQQIATAFNRLHRQTNEGGSIEEEFRQTYIADRVVTNGTAFLAMTFECCRCHDHKYDPLSQADFYRLAAFFSNIDEHGLYSHFTETAPTPALLLFEGDQQANHAKLIETIRVKESELDQIRETAGERFANHPLSKLSLTDLSELAKVLSNTNPSVVTDNESSKATSPITPKLHISFDSVKPNGENKLVTGISAQAIDFSGDDAFTCTGSGQYGRTTPFAISLWLKPAEPKPREIVLHQCVAAEDAAYRGYSLVLDNGRLQFSLIHFWPGNAIQIQARQPIAAGEWTHVVIDYDGSSKASGARLFVNGASAEVDITHDGLSRDIRYRPEWGDSNSGGVELSLGARFRDVGFRHGAIDELMVFDHELTALEVTSLCLVHPNLPAKNSLLPPATAARFEHYLYRFDQAYQAKLTELQKLRHEENEVVTRVRQIMTMRELPQPRPTHILKRGAYDAPGDLVTMETPASILAFADEYPRNRLGLAKWLTDDRNPLTSRVAVNRIWSLFFGRGIVASVEDFGGQGQTPSHPELLDWLARDFMDHGWDVKQLCKQITLSATYGQSSVPRQSRLYVDDPDNALLARGPRYRLPAEQLRDNALAVSGLLVSKQGGPSVMPYQPAGLWEEAGTGKSYQQSKGEGLYRRSMYTFWRRTSPPPSMLTFDATGREVCTARRERTATPLQALVLMNDPQFVEAARVLAERRLQDADLSPAERIQSLFRILTSRTASPRELEVLSRLYQDQKLHFEQTPDEATKLLSVGESPPDKKLNVAELAALTVVTKTLMNFDECVTKR